MNKEKKIRIREELRKYNNELNTPKHKFKYSISSSGLSKYTWSFESLLNCNEFNKSFIIDSLYDFFATYKTIDGCSMVPLINYGYTYKYAKTVKSAKTTFKNNIECYPTIDLSLGKIIPMIAIQEPIWYWSYLTDCDKYSFNKMRNSKMWKWFKEETEKNTIESKKYTKLNNTLKISICRITKGRHYVVRLDYNENIIILINNRLRKINY